MPKIPGQREQGTRDDGLVAWITNHFFSIYLVTHPDRFQLILPESSRVAIHHLPATSFIVLIQCGQNLYPTGMHNPPPVWRVSLASLPFCELSLGWFSFSAQKILHRLYQGWKQYLCVFLLEHHRWTDFQGSVVWSGGSYKNTILTHMVHDMVSHIRV